MYYYACVLGSIEDMNIKRNPDPGLNNSEPLNPESIF